ncbi:MAG TPA: protein kinase [Vicinamibacterales bacterium]|nr:protein kinase [Vicinamibacterales bacterium]
MIGERIGRYLVEERLGAGGMGTVYRAHDPQLRRAVAIKIVSRTVAGDEKSAALAEARAASSLSHPNICTVYEVGEAGPLAYIVSEFIEGRPLSELIPPGGLPAETVVRYGIQIADALAHAHDRGIVHRDLKSSNVVVGRDGRAKVLDFGLARRVPVAGADEETGLGTRETDAARFAGTLACMAPEQLVGQPADARSDIWALGVLLYEMASGELPFQGRTRFELTAAVLRAPPEPLPAHVPPMLRAIIARALVKEPLQRYERASELRAALEAIQSDFTHRIPAVPPPRRRVRSAVAAAVFVALAATALLLMARLRRDPWARWSRIAESGQLTLLLASDTEQLAPVISPDARLIAYTTEDASGRTDLYVRQITGGRPIRLTEDEAREAGPRFSPDGEMVAFARRRVPADDPEVCLAPALGGDLRCVFAPAAMPDWSPAGDRLAFLRPERPGQPVALVTARIDGSDARVLLQGDGVYPFLISPVWSPDGRHIAVVRGTGGAHRELWLVPAAGGAPRRLSTDPASVFSESPAFTADGRGLIHSSNRGGATNIWVLPLDGGAPIRLTAGPGPDESPSVARDGTVVFVNSRWRNALLVYDLVASTVRTLARHAPAIWGPAFSPDGRHVLFSRAEVDGSWHLWTIDTAGGEPARLTDTPHGEVYPRYTPDGRWVLFHTWSSPRSIWRVRAAGGPSERLAHLGEDVAFADVSPDGRWIAFVRTEPDAERIYVAGLEGGTPRRLLAGAATVPRWSPDGRRIAFSPHRGFASGIFVVDVEGGTPRRLTARGGWPVWWPDGESIAYLEVGPHGSQELYRVPAAGGAARRLELVRYRTTNFPFDVSRDGRRLVTSTAEHVRDEIWMLRPPPR